MTYLSNLIASPPDDRDYIYIPQPGPFPASIDLRPYAGAIEDQGAIGSCFLPGTPVLMADFSERAIESVMVGNKVITHLGRGRSVTRVYQRIYSGLLHTIGVQGWQYPLTATAEHPFAVVPNASRRAQWGEFQADALVWKPAKALQPGDFVVLPVARTSFGIDHIDLRKYFEVDTAPEDAGARFRTLHSPQERTLPVNVTVDERFARLIGFFLAEGSFRKLRDGSPCGLVFSFHRKEDAYHQFVRDAIEAIFGVEVYIEYPAKRQTCATVRCDNTTLAYFFQKFCGEYSYHKYVNPIFFVAPEPVRLELLRGWLMGDGTQDPVRMNNQRGEPRAAIQIEGVTTSVELHRDMFRLSLLCGMKPTGAIHKQQEYQNAEGRSLVFYSNDVLKIFPEHATRVEEAGVSPTGRTWYKRHDLGFLCRIKSVEITEAVDLMVHNLEVDEDQTYVANCIAVHNCTANATVSACELMLDRARQPLDLSRLFLYWNTRDLEDRIGQEGAALRDAFRVLRHHGVPPEAAWPYIEAQVDVQPGPAIYAEALARTARRYEAVKSPWTAYDPPELLARIKSAVGEGLPAVFAMPVGRALLGLAGPIERQHYQALNSFGNDYIGNHAMAIVGWDDTLGAFIVENSWGAQWGDRGYWALPYASLGELMEAWVLRDFAGIDIPAPPGIYLTDSSRFSVSARIVPRPEEIGQPLNLWVGASWRGQIYLQRPDRTWQAFDGTYAPVAMVVMDGPYDFDALPLNIQFDLAAFPGADVYVAYGQDVASWRLERICTIPAF